MKSALRAAGIESGMTVFCHSNIAFFGKVQGIINMNQLIEFTLNCFIDVLGKDGTLVLPTFTYSFGVNSRKKTFDIKNSLSTTSSLGNWLVIKGEGSRSQDPMLSVVAVGKKQKEITQNIDSVCFGKQSIWSRLYENDALICNLNLDSGSTYLHWVERELGVPYRKDIPMSGKIIADGNIRKANIIYTGRNLKDPLSKSRFETYHSESIKSGITKLIGLGRGQIVSQRTRAAKELFGNLLTDHPYLLTARHSP